MASLANADSATMGESEMEMYYKLAIRPLPARSRPSPAAGADADASMSRPTAFGAAPDVEAGSVSGGEEDLDFQPPPGAKKRKTPACPVVNGRHDVASVYDGDVVDGTNRHSDLAPIMLRSGRDDDDDDDEEGDGDDEGHEVAVPRSKADTRVETMKRLVRNHARSAPTRTCDHRKILFLRRKAALITLFLDATAAIKSYWKDADDKSKSNSSSATAAAAATATASKALLSKLPEVDAFEKLLPALEDVGPCDWPPDRPDWRSGVVDKEEEEHQRWLGVWRTGFAKRRKLRNLRKEVVRGGWAPEGSFEFERSSKAGNVSREGARARASLQRLAHELRHILLTIKPKTSATSTTSPAKADESSPSKTKRRTGEPACSDASTAAAAPPPQAETNAPAAGEKLERTGSGSKEGSEVGSGVGGKKKPKKKKRSVLANQSNPHHVDNYRPTRTVTSATDPNEPYPHHASLLFPPSMAFLSARPGTQQRVRASEDDFICAFCEYDLFYGTERQRRAAIRSRKQELRRKANIKNKAKSVADGKRKEESEYDDEEDEEGGEECEDQGYGKCSCGRALGPHGDKEHHLKPPDPDPNIPLPSPSMELASGPAMPRLPVLQDVHLGGGDLSRASTPSID